MAARTGDARRRLSRRGLLAAVGPVLATAACGSPSTRRRDGATGDRTTADSPSPHTPAPSAPTISGSVQARDWMTGLGAPWGLEPVDDTTMLVSERDTGTILLVAQGSRRTVATVPEAVTGPEGGLLGIRLGPDRDRLYAYCTTQQDNRVIRFDWDGERATAPTAILTGIPRATIHNGGQLLFGRDGNLFVSTGDASDSRQAQDKNVLAGKILRITPDGKAAPGNPFDSPVWTYGHRNVQGMAVDDAGNLWASEFGQNTLDELNLIMRGANYGWPAIEGDETTLGTMTNPARVWQPADCSPSGLAWWRGSLWMACLRGERLWQIPVDGTAAGTPIAHFTGRYGRLRSVAPLPGGSGLMVATNNTDGRGTPRSGDDRLLLVTAA